jgi:hypothetical protein
LCQKDAEKFARGWVKVRQRQSQTSEIEDKVKSLADSIGEREADKGKARTSRESKAGKREREAQLLSDIEELGVMAKKIKQDVSRPN